jgi:Fur family transcriptional regulator, ferric uptake regulator
VDSKRLLQAEEKKQLLRERGLKATPQRIAVLDALSGRCRPMTVEDLIGKLGRNAFDLVTLYRILTVFSQLGLVRRCDFGDGEVRYEWVQPGLSHHHHHVICTSCRRVDPMKSCSVDGLEKIVKRMGYTAISHSLEFFGKCRACSD